MALKGDRKVVVDDISGYLFSACEAGKLVVTKSSQPSGSGLGTGLGATAIVLDVVSGAPASGTRPYGVLMNDFVSIDETQQHRNWLKGDQVLGEPAYVLRKGFVVTNMVSGTPTAGAPAYISQDGKFSATQVNSIAQVGVFDTAKDSDGYARVNVNLPN